MYLVARGFNMETSEGETLRVRGAASICIWSCTIALLALAPTTALADNPGNPGHHYGQISNPGNHYGQLKHSGVQVPPPSLPPTQHTQTGPYAASGTIGATAPTTDSGSSSTDESIANQVPVPVASPAPVPQRNLWLTVILLALVLAANVAGGVVLVGRAVHFALRQVRPVGIPVPSPAKLQVKTA